jgi:hypothetical protein
MANKYTKKYETAISQLNLTNPNGKICLRNLINKIYEDGFEDGHNEGEAEENTTTGDIFLKKLVSLNPDRYEQRPLNRLIKDYGAYREYCGRADIINPPIKTFSQWLATEI